MSTVLTVMKKELKDLSRDTRTVVLTLVLAPLFAPIFQVGLGVMISKRSDTENEKALELAVVHAERAPNLIEWLGGQNVVVKPAPADPEAAIRDQSVDVIVRIGDDFEADWKASKPAEVEVLHDSSRSDAHVPVARVEKLLQAYGQNVGALRLLARGVSPSSAVALRVGDRDLMNAANRGWTSLMMLPYFLCLIAFIGALPFVVDVTAGERERQSLEPLLATPAARGAIMTGKILAASVFGIAAVALSLITFKLAFDFGPSAGVKVNVSMWVIARILVVLVPMSLLGSTLVTFLAAAAKSVKEAQGYLSILILLPMVPTMVLLVNPVKNQLWMMATPFLSQNQLIMKLLRSETVSYAEWAVYLVAGFGAAAIFWALAVRRYNDERLAISA